MTSLTGRSVRVVACVVLVATAVAASDQQLHFVAKPKDIQQPLSPADLSRRLQEAALQYQEHAPVPRIALFDIAYAANATEAENLKGYAVLLVTAICQEQTELPLHRVYALVDGKPVDLKVLGSVNSTIRDDDPVGKTFGQHRADALYLIPMFVAANHGTLVVDFAKNRDGFKVGEINGPPSGIDSRWSHAPLAEDTPSVKSLELLIQREYPGFLQ